MSMTYATLKCMGKAETAEPKKQRDKSDEPHLIQEIVRTYQLLVSVLRRRSGISASRFALMRILAEHSTDIGVMDLSRQLGVNAASITRQVRELESEGLVHRHADPNDGRRISIILSKKGRKLLDDLLEYSHQFEALLLPVLSHDEQVSAAKSLRKLRTYVEEFR